MYISKKLQSTTNGCLERNKLGNGEATTKVSKCKEPDREHQEALYGEGVYLGWRTHSGRRNIYQNAKTILDCVHRRRDG